MTDTGLGKRLAELREAKGWSKYRLAKESGVNETNVGKIEAGRDPTWSTICKLADALGVSLDRLRATG